MTDERRNSERKKILLEAKWASMSRTHEARVDDVSLGGCFVNTYGPVELGEQVDLKIHLPSGEWLPLRGQVATYQHGVGFGMAFTNLHAKEEEKLKELISASSG